MKKKKLAGLAIGLFMFLFSSLASAGAISTFDSGFDGWTFTSGVSWQVFGGNPDGYLRFEDNGPANGGQLIAPTSFLGNWSIYEGGTLSFDFRVFQTQAPTFDRSVRISGPGGTASWSGPNFTGMIDWTPVVAQITDTEWNVISGNWIDILSNVSELRVFMPDSSIAIEHTGIDNVSLNAVPIPSTIFLFGSGLAGLAGTIIRRKTK